MSWLFDDDVRFANVELTTAASTGVLFVSVRFTSLTGTEGTTRAPSSADSHATKVAKEIKKIQYSADIAQCFTVDTEMK